MGVAATMRVDVGLGGSFREAVVALTPRLYWPLDDGFDSAVAEDASNYNRDGTVTNPDTVFDGYMGPAPEGGTAALTNSFSDVRRTGSAGVPSVNGGSLVIAFRSIAGTDSVTLAGFLSDSVSGTSFGLYRNSSDNKVYFYVGHTPHFGAGTNVIASAALSHGRWYLAIATWDGTTNANGMKLYLVDTSTGTTATTQGTSTVASVAELTQFDVGYGVGAANSFSGYLAHAAAFDDDLSSGNVTTLTNAILWTDITADVDGASGLRLKFGIDGSDPTDCTPDIGQCTFTLQNFANSSGRPQGKYSPGHGSSTSAWITGIPIRVVFSAPSVGVGIIDQVRFRGKIARITPDAGRYGSQLVSVTAHDFAYDLAEHGVRELDLQIDQTEDTLLRAVLAALPFDSRPPAQSMDVGLDTLPYVFDDVRDGAKALGLVQSVTQSVLGLSVLRGDGTFAYLNRQQRQNALEIVSAQSDTFHGFRAPTDRSQLYHNVRIIIRPRTIDTAATTVLYALTGASREIVPGGTLVVWGPYRDPNDITVPIGGLDRVTPLVSGTDYVANAAADGTGANLTANVSVSVDDFASTAKFTVTNNAGVPAFMTTLQIRGKGVYRRGPQTYSHGSAVRYGSRELEFEMPYQDDAQIAQSAAEYVEAQYSLLTTRIHEMSFIANDSDDLMTLALVGEPGYVFDVSETLTAASATVVIHSIEFDVSEGPWIRCRLGLAPGAPWQTWKIGVAGYSEIGETTRVGW